jgi:hypothetical protein
MITFRGVQSQWKKTWFDTQSLLHANLTVIHDPQIHLPNPSYVEEEDECVDEEF